MFKAICLNIQFFCAVVLFAFVGMAQNRPQPKQLPARPSAPFLQYVKSYEETTYVTKIVLKNGMTVLVDEFRIQPLVTMQAYIQAGFKDDPTQLPGAAKLVSAVVMRGPADKSGGTYRQKIQALGGASHAETNYTSTLFEITAPSGQWKRALGVQAEAIQNPSFDAESIKAEAKMLQSDANAALDDPQVLAKEKLFETAFDRPRMALNSTIGRAGLQACTPDNLSAFYRAMYTPSKMMLVISGDISSGEVLNEVARLYAKSAGAGAKPGPLTGIPPQNEFRFAAARTNVAAPILVFGFHTAAENEEDARAVEVLSAIAGLGNAAVLPARLRDEKKLVLSARADLYSSPEFGFLSIGAEVAPAKIDQSEIAILTEMELLKREEPSEPDMERAFAQLERNYWETLETVTGRAFMLAHFEALGDWKRLERYVSDLRKVKPADVKRAAAKYLRLQNCTLLELLPPSAENRQLTAESMRNTFASLLSAAADEEKEKRDKQTVLAVKAPPPSGFKFSEVRYPFQTASILRGPELFIREDHSSPLIEMGLFFPGGRLDEKRENAGITTLLTSLLLTGGADSAQFYRQLEVYGGRVLPVVADDYFGIYLSVLSQSFEPAFRQILSAIREPKFDEPGMARQKEIQLLRIRSGKYTGEFPSDLMQRTLFGSFPYALDRAGTESSLQAITLDSVNAWYGSHVKNRKPVVTLIGDTRGTSLASLFVQNFSGSRIQDSKLPEGYAKAPDKGQASTQEWDGSESVIFVGFQAPPVDDEDAAATSVLEAYSGDTGRFSQELRDRLGISHRVTVRYQPRIRGGSIILCAAATPGTEESVLKALREEIQRTHDGPISYRDFRSAVSTAVGLYSIRQQARFSQISEITENALAGKGLDEYQAHAAGLQEVQEEDLSAVARKIFNMEKAAILVVRAKNRL